MKALLCRDWGGPETLTVEEVADPVAGPGEVVIDVEGCASNFADTLIIQGKYQVKPDLPFTPGMEVAGTIAAVGEGVEEFAAGDAVIGMMSTGGYAEKVACKAENVVPRSAPVPGAIACSLPVAYGTAHISLDDRARMKPGESLLVHGASGGVGLAAVEVGKAMGATVIATASSEEKLAIARQHGADHLIDYTRGEFRHEVKALTGGGADVIFDPVGGDIFDQSMRCIAWGGRLLVVGFAAGRIPEARANIVLVKNIALMGVHWGSYRSHPGGREVLRDSFGKIFGWIKEGKLKPLVSKTYALNDAPQAIMDLAERRATGKIVVTP
ncbi:MAG: NADPH:quinone oxidoreductase family protein [Rhodospirillales bacterium]|nr:NADPH:quinone oxidoreductase family protein [Rhodospirillales bacterium]